MSIFSWLFLPFDAEGSISCSTTSAAVSSICHDGTAAQLKNGAVVEAEGTVDAQGVLVARKVEFEEAKDDN